MDIKKAASEKGKAFNVLTTSGVIGLHMVSGPLVGFGIGYLLDYWLGSNPFFKISFLLIGVGAGFKNVYIDTQKLLKRMQEEDERRKRS